MATLLLNDPHPPTPAQYEQVAVLPGGPPEVGKLAAHADRARSFTAVARELADTAGLSLEARQVTPLLLNLPSPAPLALALIAELHRCCVVRPLAGSTPTRCGWPRSLNLQALRKAARERC